MKKVYFAGSIRGGREDAGLYQRLIAHINETDKVLTEHIGNLSLSVFEGSENHERDIYLQDTGWIKECDLLIAECTTASLGVGYELAYAESLKKPVYIFYRPAKTNLSAMLTGDSYFKIFRYNDESELFRLVDAVLKGEA